MLTGASQRLYEAVNYVRLQVNRDFAMSQFAMFLLVAVREGITMAEVAEFLQLSQGAVSRNLRQLSKYKDERGNIQGYNLIYSQSDLTDRRRFALYLTPKGRQLIADLEYILER